jgi:hypothetical protein
MITKLTLSLNEEKVKKKIKCYSKEKGISVSKIFEDHIDRITGKSGNIQLDIMKLKGAFGKAPKNFDWKKERKIRDWKK